MKTNRAAGRITAADAAVILALAAASLVPAFLGGRGPSVSAARLEVLSSVRPPVNIPSQVNGLYAFAGPLGETVVEVRDGRGRVKSSPCPNQLCVREGWKEKAGQKIVCAPNRVGLLFKGEEEGIDAVTR